MFISNLNSRQQSILLSIAQELVLADGKTDEAEERLMQEIRRQVPDAVTAEPCAMGELSSAFDSRKSAVSLLAELIGIGYIDTEYNDRERSLVQKVASAIGLEAELPVIEAWVGRMSALINEAETLMEEQ